jgi:hypothetical protein
MATQTVKYGTTTIEYARVSYSARAVYDESDRAIRYHVVSFNVSGIVHGAGADGSVSTTDMRDKVYDGKAALELILSNPRQDFTWKLNGVSVFVVKNATTAAAGEFTDVAQGPKPRAVAVQQVVGGRSFRVSFQVDCAIALQDAAASVPVDTFSFSVAMSYDKNWNAVRHVNGTIGVRMTGVGGTAPLRDIASIFVSGAKNTGGFDPNTFLPRLPGGWERDGWNYAVSPDGARLQFSCVDRQRWRVLPAGITSGSCVVQISQSGGTLQKSMSGYFECPASTNKQLILDVIASLIEFRFSNAINPVPGAKAERIVNFSVTNHDFDNRIEFSIATSQASANLSGSGNLSQSVLNLLTDIQDVTPAIGSANFANIGANEASAPPAAGTSGLIQQVDNPFNNASGGGGDPAMTTATNSGITATTGREVPSTPGGALSPGTGSDGGQSLQHLEFPFTTYVDCMQFVLDYQNVILSTATDDLTYVGTGNGYTNPDTVQQTARPRLLLIHTGKARRIGAMPIIPRAYLFAPNAILMRDEPRLFSPRFLADGKSLEFQSEWNSTYYIPGVNQLAGKDGTDAYDGSDGVISINRPPSQQINENLAAYDGTRIPAFDGTPPTGTGYPSDAQGTVTLPAPAV